MKKQLLLILMTLLPMVTWADESGTCGDNLTWTYYSSTHSLVIAGSGDMYNYSYEKIDDEYVSTAPWNKYRNELVSVNLPEGLSSIGKNAFLSCSGLISVPIGKKVTSIGENAFANCSSLTSVTIPNSVTSIGGTAFGACSSLNEIIVRSETPPFVYNNTFSNYNGTLKVPDAGWEAYVAHEIWGLFGTIQTISGEFVDSGTCGDNLTWTYYESTHSLVFTGSGDMYNYSYSNNATAPWYKYRDYLVSVNLPEGLTSIGAYAFYNCINLTSVNIPNSVTSISECVFSGCI